MQPPKQPKYYISYTFFKGDEHTGESVSSGHVVEAESDKQALQKLTKYVVSEREGEITRIHNVQNVSGLFDLVNDAIEVEEQIHGQEGQKESEMSDFQKYNVAFAVAHWLYGK